MTRLPRVTAAQVLRKLRRAGFSEVGQRGSHIRLRNGEGRSTTVPNHAGKTLKPKTLTAILDHTGLTIDEFNNL